MHLGKDKKIVICNDQKLRRFVNHLFKKHFNLINQAAVFQWSSKRMKYFYWDSFSFCWYFECERTLFGKSYFRTNLSQGNCFVFQKCKMVKDLPFYPGIIDTFSNLPDQTNHKMKCHNLCTYCDNNPSEKYEKDGEASQHRWLKP